MMNINLVSPRVKPTIFSDSAYFTDISSSKLFWFSIRVTKGKISGYDLNKVKDVATFTFN